MIRFFEGVFINFSDIEYISMSGGYTRCKVCEKFILSPDANYCSSHCKALDIRMYYTRLTLIVSFLSISTFTFYAISIGISIIYLGLTLSAYALLVFIPLYQFLQTTKIEQKIKTVYHKRTTIETDDGERVQPVYIYLYISRFTEEDSMYQDDDFSEYV